MHDPDAHDSHDAAWIALQQCQAPFDEAAQAIATASAFAGGYGKAGGLLAYGVHLSGAAYCDPTSPPSPASYVVAKTGYDPYAQAPPTLGQGGSIPSSTGPDAGTPDVSTHSPSDSFHIDARPQQAAFDLGRCDREHDSREFEFSAILSQGSWVCSPGDLGHGAAGFDYSGNSPHESRDFTQPAVDHSGGGFDFSAGNSIGSCDVSESSSGDAANSGDVSSSGSNNGAGN